MKLDIHARLQSEQVSHPEEARIYGRRVLNLKGPDNSSAFDP